MAWTFTFTDMIEAFPSVKPTESSVVGDLNISGFSDGCSGSFNIKWHNHSDAPTPVLEAWCDSWEALNASGVMALLVAHDTNKDRPADFREPTPPPVTLAEIKAELLALGFTDNTGKYRSQGPDRCTCCNGKGFIYKTAKENAS